MISVSNIAALSFFLVSLCIVATFVVGQFFSFLVFFVLILAVIVFIWSGGRFKGRFNLELLLCFFCLLSSVFSYRFGSYGGFYLSSFMFLSFLFSLTFYSISFSESYFLVGAHKAIKVVFLLYLSYLIFCFVLKGVGPLSADDYLAIGSRNMVSAVLIYLQIIYSIIFFYRFSSVPVLTPIITFIVCLFLFGRSGILISGIWLAVSIFYRVSEKKYSVSAFLILAFFVIFAISDVPDTAFHYLILETKFRHGFESNRMEMWVEYFLSIDILSFFVGQSYDLSPSIEIYGGGSPHSSFINGHHFMGFPYLVLIALMFFRSVFFAFFNGFFVFIGFFLLVFRAGFDVIAMPGLFSVFVFLAYFLCFSSVSCKCKNHFSVVSAQGHLPGQRIIGLSSAQKHE